MRKSLISPPGALDPDKKEGNNHHKEYFRRKEPNEGVSGHNLAKEFDDPEHGAEGLGGF